MLCFYQIFDSQKSTNIYIFIHFILFWYALTLIQIFDVNCILECIWNKLILNKFEEKKKHYKKGKKHYMDILPVFVQVYLYMSVFISLHLL